MARRVVWTENAIAERKEILKYCDERLPRHITQAWGEVKVSDKPLWQHSCEGSLAMAVTAGVGMLFGVSV